MKDDLSHQSLEWFSWTGSRVPYLDAPTTTCRGKIVIGRYGGCSAAGAAKNEDGALVLSGSGWEFTAILDSHSSGESVDLLATTLEAEGASIAEALDSPLSTAFAALQEHILGLFRSAAFRARCANVRGETACLLCARKEGFVWWLSIGDCLVYLLHPDLARLK